MPRPLRTLNWHWKEKCKLFFLGTKLFEKESFRSIWIRIYRQFSFTACIAIRCMLVPFSSFSPFLAYPKWIPSIDTNSKEKTKRNCWIVSSAFIWNILLVSLPWSSFTWLKDPHFSKPYWSWTMCKICMSNCPCNWISHLEDFQKYNFQLPNTFFIIFFIFYVNPASILEYTNALRCAEHQGEPHSMLAKE